MKKLIIYIKTLCIVIYFSTYYATGQDITGKWYATLLIESNELRLIFDIVQTDSLLSATLSSPDQGVSNIPLEKVRFNNSVLSISHPPIGMEYSGVYTNERILGTFRQSGLSAPLQLTKRAPEGSGRPQEPGKPYPYKENEILFINYKDSIVLAGTLSCPAEGEKFDAVILISGSGPQNRNQEIAGHKPFLVLSDHLTKSGLAVLRYDDRGVGASGGVFANATTIDFAEDLFWAVRYLESRDDINRIGLIGHSEGAIVASIVASQHPGKIEFIVLMAGPALPGKEILLTQQEAISLAGGSSKEEVLEYIRINRGLFSIIEESIESLPMEKVRDSLELFLNNETGASVGSAIIRQQVNTLTSPWMLFFLNYDPRNTLSKVQSHILAINGTKDLQVLAAQNLNQLYNTIIGGDREGEIDIIRNNKHVTIIEFEGINHLFQLCNTGHPSEYSKIEETINPSVLDTISAWINRILQ